MIPAVKWLACKLSFMDGQSESKPKVTTHIANVKRYLATYLLKEIGEISIYLKVRVGIKVDGCLRRYQAVVSDTRSGKVESDDDEPNLLHL